MDTFPKEAKNPAIRGDAGSAAARRQKSERELTIREMAETHGVSLRTLRYYELRGLLSPRREGRARFYSLEDSTRLKSILSGKEFGFTLAEISDSIRMGNTKTQFAEALPEKTILEQLDYLEERRRDLNKAITRLKAIHRRPSHDEKGPSEQAAVEWRTAPNSRERKGAA
jgi:DNA-binding transcriptional MerR regulator